MTSTELIKKELEKQILMLSKFSERKIGLTRTKIKTAHEIAQLSYVLIMCENSVNHQKSCRVNATVQTAQS